MTQDSKCRDPLSPKPISAADIDGDDHDLKTLAPSIAARSLRRVADLSADAASGTVTIVVPSDASTFDSECHGCNHELPADPRDPKCWHYCDRHCYDCTMKGIRFCEQHRNDPQVLPKRRRDSSFDDPTAMDGSRLPPEYQNGTMSAKRALSERIFHLRRAEAIETWFRKHTTRDGEGKHGDGEGKHDLSTDCGHTDDCPCRLCRPPDHRRACKRCMGTKDAFHTCMRCPAGYDVCGCHCYRCAGLSGDSLAINSRFPCSHMAPITACNTYHELSPCPTGYNCKCLCADCTLDFAVGVSTTKVVCTCVKDFYANVTNPDFGSLKKE